MATKAKKKKEKPPHPPINPHLMGFGASRKHLDDNKWNFNKAKRDHQKLGKKLMELTGEKDHNKMRHFMGSRPHGIVAAHLANKPNSEGSLKVLYGRFCSGGYDPMRFCAEGKEEISRMIREGEDLEPLVQDLIDNGYTDEEIEHYITEGSLLEQNLEKLFNSIVDEKPLDASEAIHDIITSKLSGAIDQYKESLAQSVFGGGDEDEDEPEEDDSDKSDESDDEVVEDDDGVVGTQLDDMGINFEDMTDEQLAQVIADAESDDQDPEEVDEGVKDWFKKRKKKKEDETYKGDKMKVAPNGKPFKEDTEYLTELPGVHNADNLRGYVAGARDRIEDKSYEIGKIKGETSVKRKKGNKGAAKYMTKGRKTKVAAAEKEILKRSKYTGDALERLRVKTPRGRGKKAH